MRSRSLQRKRFYERGEPSSENGCVAPIDRSGYKKILRDSAKNPTKSIKIRKHQIDTRKFRRPRSG